jgi:hypothetical protein
MGYHGGFITRQNGKKKDRGMVAKIQNSFGLPGGHSCPGRTGFCDDCYAMRNSEIVFPNVGRAMWHNWDVLETFYVQHGIDGYIALLEEAVRRFEKQIDYYELDESQRVFRIHWDGDFFSHDYAVAWAQVIRNHPRIKFWVYTRSFHKVNGSINVIPDLLLVPPDNLQIYLSIDWQNYSYARLIVESYDQVLLAACAEDYAKCRWLIDATRGIYQQEYRSTHGKGMTPCPENAQRIPLISDTGVGACVKCGICIRGSRDIMFSTSHKENAGNPDQEVMFPDTVGREVITSVRLPAPKRKGQEEARTSDEEEATQAPLFS